MIKNLTIFTRIGMMMTMKMKMWEDEKKNFKASRRKSKKKHTRTHKFAHEKMASKSIE